MRIPLKYLLHSVVILATAFCLSGCGDDEDVLKRELGFEKFVPKYNAYVANWLKKEHSRVTTEIAEVEKSMEGAEGKEKSDKEDVLSDLKRELERIEFRQSLGDYFDFKKAEDIPQDLQWEDGMDEPEIGDPRAVKGGVFRHFMTQFPATVRPFGKESNNGFRSYIYEELEIGLVGLHPKTMKVIPGTAQRWAVSEDGRTVYYELDPDARYNDGHVIPAKDYMVGIYVRVSDNVAAPYEKQYFREQFAQVTVYGEKYLSVSLPEPKPLMPYFGNLAAAPSHFYKDYAADYVDFYQWKVQPHTGAYFVRDKDIVKGVSVTLTRDKDWWAKDKKYYKHRYNADKIVYTTIRDISKAFELFRAGQLDVFGLTQPDYWYEKSEIDPVFNGYIERYKFYTQFPRVPRGAYLNVYRPILKNRDARIGICHALNWQKVIDVVFRGDYDRLQQFSEGYGDLTNPDVKARPFSVSKAREYFAKAGYTEEGPDGILRKPSGERLAVNMSYPNVGFYGKVVAILKEESKKAGMELRADGQEATVFYKQVMQKEHDMVIWGWGSQPPFPRYYQSFYSKNAYDSQGNPKPQTNNINSYADDEMDKLCKGVRYARTVEEVKSNSWKIQQIIKDEALFSPGWVTNFVRIGSWRWVRWPDTKETPFNVPVIYEPMESYVYWIDPEIQRDTEAAMRANKKFPEVQKVIDVYQNGIPKSENDETEAAPTAEEEGDSNE
ncbi:ABC transporter substrate-binding protein [Oceaniferula spumae]|uniref:ABC transporter substrate-binding protein n=1 Tax=Oceaniferula spumae TaxID=2979115 RepID=A0AAT9FJ38_9BACT